MFGGGMPLLSRRRSCAIGCQAATFRCTSEVVPSHDDPQQHSRPAVARSDRRYQGGPEYPIERVIALARLQSLRITVKARDEATAVLPSSIGSPVREIRGMLLSLTETQWRFAQENERGWVDVYRVERHRLALWLTLKIEQERSAKELVIVLSCHEYDDDIPD